jgi:hypothetical protein
MMWHYIDLENLTNSAEKIHQLYLYALNVNQINHEIFKITFFMTWIQCNFVVASSVLVRAIENNFHTSCMVIKSKSNGMFNALPEHLQERAGVSSNYVAAYRNTLAIGL